MVFKGRTQEIKMTINKFRSILYATAKYSGDVQAVTSKRKGSISRRIMRRIAGYFTGRALGGMFR